MPLAFSTEEMLQLFGQQQHEFMNSLQVAMGLLQLNRNSQALEYLKYAVKNMENRHELLQLNDIEAIRTIFGWLTEARRLDLKVDLEVGMKGWPQEKESYGLLKGAGEIWNLLRGICAKGMKRAAGFLSLELWWKEDLLVALHIQQSFQIDLETIRKAVSQGKTGLQLNLEEEEGGWRVILDCS